MLFSRERQYVNLNFYHNFILSQRLLVTGFGCPHAILFLSLIIIILFSKCGIADVIAFEFVTRTKQIDFDFDHKTFISIFLHFNRVCFSYCICFTYVDLSLKLKHFISARHKMSVFFPFSSRHTTLITLQMF